MNETRTHFLDYRLVCLEWSHRRSKLCHRECGGLRGTLYLVLSGKRKALQRKLGVASSIKTTLSDGMALVKYTTVWRIQYGLSQGHYDPSLYCTNYLSQKRQTQPVCRKLSVVGKTSWQTGPLGQSRAATSDCGVQTVFTQAVSRNDECQMGEPGQSCGATIDFTKPPGLQQDTARLQQDYRKTTATLQQPLYCIKKCQDRKENADYGQDSDYSSGNCQIWFPGNFCN